MDIELDKSLFNQEDIAKKQEKQEEESKKPDQQLQAKRIQKKELAMVKALDDFVDDG